MSLKRRQFTKEFKLQLLREIEGGKSAAQAAREHQVHPNTIYKWQKQYEKHGPTAFPGNGMCGNNALPATEAGKIAELERLIGEMTVENAFLKRVLTTLEAQQAQHARQTASGEAR